MIQQRLERKAAYEATKEARARPSRPPNPPSPPSLPLRHPSLTHLRPPLPLHRHRGLQDVTKWQPLVKANREVATLEFPNRRDGAPRKTSVQAVLSDFKPETQLELEASTRNPESGAAGSLSSARPHRPPPG